MADTRTAARRSYPRDVVVRVLNESYDHPTAYTVYERARKIKGYGLPQSETAYRKQRSVAFGNGRGIRALRRAYGRAFAFCMQEVRRDHGYLRKAAGS